VKKGEGEEGEGERSLKNNTMASRVTLQQALGTDGSDFHHRQRIATHYQTRWAIDYKSKHSQPTLFNPLSLIVSQYDYSMTRVLL
jgi:hypothetical protein